MKKHIGNTLINRELPAHFRENKGILFKMNLKKGMIKFVQEIVGIKKSSIDLFR